MAPTESADILLPTIVPTDDGQGMSTTNILLLSVDSLRPDHLSFAGYERPTSPNIDRLAEDSRASHLLCTPGLYRALLEQCDPRRLETLHTVMVGGDTCSAGGSPTDRNTGYRPTTTTPAARENNLRLSAFSTSNPLNFAPAPSTSLRRSSR